MNYSQRNRKHPIALLIAVLAILALFTACSRGNDGSIYINKQYAESGMLTINKDAFDYENGKLLDTSGVGLVPTDAMQELSESGKLFVIADPFGLHFIYFTEQTGEVSISSTNMFQYLAISRIPSDDPNGAEAIEMLEKSYSKVEVFTTIGNDTCYISYNDDYSELTLTDTDKATLDLLFSEREELKNNICLFPPVVITFSTGANMNDFNAATLSGDTFTQNELTKYDLTMVNIWTTWCGPCISEMPDLQELYEKLPDNVNLITVCADAGEETELANEIINDSGCKFNVLIPDDKLQKSLVDEVNAYPTTVFVDKNGNIVGDVQVGVPGQNPAEAYMKIIEERLDMAVGGK